MPTSSRHDILQNIRRQTLPTAELPSLAHDWIHYADPADQFRLLLESVGGQCHTVAGDVSSLATAIAALPCWSGCRKFCAGLPELSQALLRQSPTSGPAPLRAEVNVEDVEDPHLLDEIDVAIYPGEFGVAENGAVWVTDREVRHRAVYWLAQHLVLVLPKSKIVNNMFDAYEKISFEQPGFGAFISGPSKTADIEQSLVIGAHGPRSLTALLTV